MRRDGDGGRVCVGVVLGLGLGVNNFPGTRLHGAQHSGGRTGGDLVQEHGLVVREFLFQGGLGGELRGNAKHRPSQLPVMDERATNESDLDSRIGQLPDLSHYEGRGHCLTVYHEKFGERPAR